MEMVPATMEMVPATKSGQDASFSIFGGWHLFLLSGPGDMAVLAEHIGERVLLPS